MRTLCAIHWCIVWVESTLFDVVVSTYSRFHVKWYFYGLNTQWIIIGRNLYKVNSRLGVSCRRIKPSLKMCKNAPVVCQLKLLSSKDNFDACIIFCNCYSLEGIFLGAKVWKQRLNFLYFQVASIEISYSFVILNNNWTTQTAKVKVNRMKINLFTVPLRKRIRVCTIHAIHVCVCVFIDK